MKKLLFALGIVTLCLSLSSAHAQPQGGPPPGTGIDAAMAKIFGDNTAFSATLESSAIIKGSTVTSPGKIAYLEGKTRMDMNMSDIKGSGMPPEAAEHLKAMGMDAMIIIARPDKQASYMICPNIQAYADIPGKKKEDSTAADKFKVESTELGKETVDGHPTVKNKTVVTDDKGKAHEYTVWNATDLKKFPVKIDSTEDGQKVTMLFKNVKLAKPDASQFELPTGLTHYTSVQTMMMTEMMKKMGNGGGFPPPGQ